MGLSFNHSKKNIYKTPRSAIKSSLCKRKHSDDDNSSLSFENISFLKSLGYKVNKNGKSVNFRPTKF